jgi:hypothetical protein
MAEKLELSTITVVKTPVKSNSRASHNSADHCGNCGQCGQCSSCGTGNCGSN